jgi:hypothetical protein
MAKYISTKTYGNEQGLSCCFRQWRSTHSHCSLLHGYSIGVRAKFESETLDDRNWVMDFGGLKAFKAWLEYMLPFLRVKRQQAIDALEFITSIKHPNLSPGIIDTIKDQRDRNISIKKIAKSLGVSHSAVRYQLIKLGGYEPLERKKNTIWSFPSNPP